MTSERINLGNGVFKVTVSVPRVRQSGAGCFVCAPTTIPVHSPAAALSIVWRASLFGHGFSSSCLSWWSSSLLFTFSLCQGLKYILEMILHSAVLTNSWSARAQRPIFSIFVRRCFTSAELSPSVNPPKVSHIDGDSNDFLSWLEHKAGTKISSALAIGNSSHGRTLYAAEDIQSGDCILKIPFNVLLSSDNLPPEINSLFGDEISSVAKQALLILHEKWLGKNSEWAPYINCLPRDLHNTVFWSDEELDMIRPSALYRETLRQKAQIEKDFSAVKLAFHNISYQFPYVMPREFAYAYGLVTSRAWVGLRGVSMIPFADFLNHSCNSESYVLSDESQQHSVVIADRDFALGDEVLINYGNFSNASLLLDFGFTVCGNKYDQAQIELTVPQSDVLYEKKLELLERHQTPSVKDINEFTSLGNAFTFRKVKNDSLKGKGIPQSARAFSRILACHSQEELNELALVAEENDGRLARCPLKDKNREIAAHRHLFTEISRLIEEYDKRIEFLAYAPMCTCGKSATRRQLARELLSGESCVLKSAAVWLENYCLALSMNR
ncbi:SET domain-containing protein [Striga hermonthica]|uniref:SET domain-containing protein n=1 Tax=Striga hermonthica TaxID=68872 RepID=A0A9N7RJE4_STRHE|nr:SET domain-containing protein [Striga hermonthica]